jgi:hypothetical protein
LARQAIILKTSGICFRQKLCCYQRACDAAGKSIPSWFIFGTRDNSIPANLLAFMAERAGSKKTVTIEGA